MKNCLSKFLTSCHICQIVGKPNQTIPSAPLIPIPIMGNLFEKIIIDCVGPLTTTLIGNKYILTIMCTSTRFPIAIPLKNITSKSIANNLLHIFTIYGINKGIQSDQWTKFTSDLFRAVLKELNIVAVASSAYHTESQGALEHFHQTLKAMLKCYCLDTILDFNERLPFLLFAVRKSKQELLYGREVRGPLKFMKDNWLKEHSVEYPKVSVKTYLTNLREKLERVLQLARESLETIKTVMKKIFDHKAKSREIQPGDQVLKFYLFQDLIYPLMFKDLI